MSAALIPDTGQTKCYDTAGEIPCPLPGQPFYGQDAQYPHVARSYTKLDEYGQDLPDSAAAWSLLRDNVTGLIWECKTDDGSIHDTGNNGTWDWANDTFIPAINEMYFGGFDDWRLPAIKELSYLVNRGRVKPAMNAEFFPNIALYYWTATLSPACSPEGLGPYYVQTHQGYEYNFIKDGGGAMAVRGTPDGFENDFIDNGDGTVTDVTTGLMWQQHGPSDPMNWREALAYCESLKLAEYTDWRLPNIHELQSIVDYTRCNPTIDTSLFPSTANTAYFSSTTIVNRPAKAWTMQFCFGYIDFYFGGVKTDPYFIRAVRRVSATLIELASFAASRRPNSVTLRWSTSSENDTAGFNLLRAEAASGPYTQINAALIPARGSADAGAAYTYTDSGAGFKKTCYYVLEDIDLGGVSTRHDPIRTTPSLLPALWR